VGTLAVHGEEEVSKLTDDFVTETTVPAYEIKRGRYVYEIYPTRQEAITATGAIFANAHQNLVVVTPATPPAPEAPDFPRCAPQAAPLGPSRPHRRRRRPHHH
jgi:hypothetical protein